MPGTSRSGSWWGQKRDLCTLLRRFQSSKATDERDKIYALLGMSTNPLDIQNIDIDYEAPVHEVLQKVTSYLLQSTPVSIHEMLNLMNNFATLDTIYFVPPFRIEEATEILFPQLQSGKKRDGTENLDDGSQSVIVVKDPSLFLFERRLRSDLKDQETCHGQAAKLMFDPPTSKIWRNRIYDNFGLQVIPWGGVEQHVKVVEIYDEKIAIVEAALKGCDQLVGAMLHIIVGDEAKKELGESALQVVVEGGYTGAVRTILNQSTHVRVRIGNALGAAAASGHKTIVELLLQYGAHTNTPVELDGSALNGAARAGNEAIVKILLDHGAKVNAQHGIHGTALQNAAVRASEAVVKMLLEHGADVNAQSGHYGNALQAAAYKGTKTIVELLLQYGAKVNAQGGHYSNALYAALFRDNRVVVEILLDAGAEVDAQSRTLVNDWSTAAEDYEEVVKMLQHHDRDH